MKLHQSRSSHHWNTEQYISLLKRRHDSRYHSSSGYFILLHPTVIEIEHALHIILAKTEILVDFLSTTALLVPINKHTKCNGHLITLLLITMSLEARSFSYQERVNYWSMQWKGGSLVEHLHATFHTGTVVAEGTAEGCVKLVHPFLGWRLCPRLPLAHLSLEL